MIIIFSLSRRTNVTGPIFNFHTGGFNTARWRRSEAGNLRPGSRALQPKPWVMGILNSAVAGGIVSSCHGRDSVMAT